MPPGNQYTIPRAVRVQSESLPLATGCWQCSKAELFLTDICGYNGASRIFTQCWRCSTVSDFKEDILKGRVALVTGGATGIGKEIARTLGKHGARIVITSRKQENLEAARKEFQEQGIECLAVPSDVRNAEAVEAVIASAITEFGGLNIIVNCAAGMFPAPIERMSYNGFKTVVDIDLLGTYNVTKAAYTAYLKEHGGCIVNITAPFEHWGVSSMAHVAAAKNGIESLTRTCAVEWAPLGIRVNSVAPGFISDTEGVKRFTDSVEVEVDKSLKGTRQDMANAVLFLVSDSASFISGVCIRVDGAATIDLLRMPVV
ncbi:MAG: SDR family oxidoreductase [Dehalococcoidia bacterium]|nr:SDR family oxidoreductase [Dehalococcoidia bacterium]